MQAQIELHPFPGSLAANTTTRGASVPGCRKIRCASFVSSSRSFGSNFSCGSLAATGSGSRFTELLVDHCDSGRVQQYALFTKGL